MCGDHILPVLHCLRGDAFVSNYRQDAAKRQTAGIIFTNRPKIRFFAPQGRLVSSIHVKLGMADRHLGRLSCAKFHISRHRGWECGPKVSTFSTVRRGEPLDRFLKKLGAFLRVLAISLLQIWHDSLHRLRSYCRETARRSIRPNFSVHPVGKAVWSRKWMTPLWWPRGDLSPCKVWRRSYNAVGCENVVFVFCLFFWVRSTIRSRGA